MKMSVIWALSCAVCVHFNNPSWPWYSIEMFSICIGIHIVEKMSFWGDPFHRWDAIIILKSSNGLNAITIVCYRQPFCFTQIGLTGNYKNRIAKIPVIFNFQNFVISHNIRLTLGYNMIPDYILWNMQSFFSDLCCVLLRFGYILALGGIMKCIYIHFILGCLTGSEAMMWLL